MNQNVSVKPLSLALTPFLLLYASFSANAQSLSVSDLSLTSLRDISVTSVSKQPENSFDAAAAIYVLTEEDIKRSGATSIPEALRYVPGLDVSRIDGNRWAVSARGFNREFANKLLVLVDGRSVYTPLFSGTYWDAQDYLLDDIERIEVIRGPGATLWGANAVNGVINIITKGAQFTQGNHAALTVGNFERNLEFRHGSKLSNKFFYRASSKISQTESTHLESGDKAFDKTQNGRFDFRAEWLEDNHNRWTFITGAYQGTNQRRNVLPGQPDVFFGEEDIHGINVLLRREHNTVHQNSQLQVYLDHSGRDHEFLINQKNTTFDIDWQHGLDVTNRFNFTWGLGYRYFVDDLDSDSVNGITYIDYLPDDSDNNLYSAFLQAKYQLIPNSLTLTVGSKFEHNFYTDFEYQPTARLAWRVANNQTVWGAISRAVRVPSRGERDINLVDGFVPPSFLVSLRGSDSFKAEELTAYELGYRYEPFEWLSLDISSFINVYDNLRSFEQDSLFSAPLGNGLNATVKGVEFSSRSAIGKDTALILNYAYNTADFGTDSTSLDVFSEVIESGITPKHSASLSIRHNLNQSIELDTNLTYRSDIRTYNVPDAFNYNVRGLWKIDDGLDVSLVAANIFSENQREFGDAFFSEVSEPPQSIYIKLSASY